MPDPATRRCRARRRERTRIRLQGLDRERTQRLVALDPVAQTEHDEARRVQPRVRKEGPPVVEVSGQDAATAVTETSGCGSWKSRRGDERRPGDLPGRAVDQQNLQQNLWIRGAKPAPFGGRPFRPPQTVTVPSMPRGGRCPIGRPVA